MKDVDPERLVFIDESGSTISMSPLCGRSPRGERCIDHVPRNRGTVTTMIGALRVDRMNALITIEGGTSTDVFEAYVVNVLGPTLWPGDIVVMDNLPAHRHERVRDAIHRFGAFVKYLPPYSPELNPIELAWSTLKHWLRESRARTHAALDEAIDAAARNIRTSQAAAWVKHCGYKVRAA